LGEVFLVPDPRILIASDNVNKSYAVLVVVVVDEDWDELEEADEDLEVGTRDELLEDLFVDVFFLLITKNTTPAITSKIIIPIIIKGSLLFLD
jgi:hypothetical protein